MSAFNFDQLDKGQWFMYPPPLGGEPWRILRTQQDQLVLESPALLQDPQHESMRMALWMGLSQTWETPARLLMRDGTLRLQASWPMKDLPDASALWSLLKADVNTAVGALESAQRQDISPEDDVALRQMSEQQKALMHKLLVLMQSDSSLQPLLDWDPDSANLSIEKTHDEADWLVLMQPALKDGCVWAFVPQAILPDEEEAARKMLATWLQKNDVLHIGPQIQIVVDQEGLQPLLQTQFEGNHTGLAELRVILGRLLALDEDISLGLEQPALTAETSSEPELSYLLDNGLRG